MTNRSQRAFYWIVGGVLLAASMLPYLFAAQAGGEALVFGGFLFNPIDGNSYLAKMQQGYSGAWHFTLPYTAEKGAGWFLFLYYLFLGHVARWTRLSLLWVYHLARLVGCLALLAGLYRIVQRSLGDGPMARLAFLLACFGSGLGAFALAALPPGNFTADFWVAEAYPFLSALAAPHFSLGLGILLFLLAPPSASVENKPVWQNQALRTTLLAFILAIISPFGVVVALVGLAWPAARAFLPLRREGIRELLGEKFAWVLLGGAPWLLYDQWAAWRDPWLAGWNAQNLTPTPPLWDLVLSLSPLLVLALPGAIQTFQGGSPALQRVAAWMLLGFGLLFVPIGLQRRFMMGLYVPVTVLGVWFLGRLRSNPRRLWLAGSVILILTLPTQLVLLLSFQNAIQNQDLHIYYTQGEAQAFNWITQETSPDSLILAAPDTGLLLPAHTGRRVIYGHPFETVNAVQEEQAVTAFFTEPETAFLRARRVDYVFYGPRERLLAGDQAAQVEQALQGLRVVYASQGVSLYAVTP